MKTSHRSLRLLGVMILLAAVAMIYRLSSSGQEDAEAGGMARGDERARPAFLAGEGHRAPRFRGLAEWRREVDRLLGKSEAGRSWILGHKRGVDADLYLLAVEPPSVEEVVALRDRLRALGEEVDPARRATSARIEAELIRDYDAWGEQGRRVIQIDIPDEPNGRLTGFTCAAGDFAEIEARFQSGEMTDLQHLRGYAADYAGMPLSRFAELMTTVEMKPASGTSGEAR